MEDRGTPKSSISTSDFSGEPSSYWGVHIYENLHIYNVRSWAIRVSFPGLILSELRMLKWEARRFRETLALFVASNVNSIICDWAYGFHFFRVTCSNTQIEKNATTWC